MLPEDCPEGWRQAEASGSERKSFQVVVGN